MVIIAPVTRTNTTGGQAMLMTSMNMPKIGNNTMRNIDRKLKIPPVL